MKLSSSDNIPDTEPLQHRRRVMVKPLTWLFVSEILVFKTNVLSLFLTIVELMLLCELLQICARDTRPRVFIRTEQPLLVLDQSVHSGRSRGTGANHSNHNSLNCQSHTFHADVANSIFPEYFFPTEFLQV